MQIFHWSVNSKYWLEYSQFHAQTKQKISIHVVHFGMQKRSSLPEKTLHGYFRRVSTVTGEIRMINDVTNKATQEAK